MTRSGSIRCWRSAAGGLAALAAAVSLPPLVAFAAGVLAVLFAVALARPRRAPAPAVAPEPPPARAAKPSTRCPRRFGRALIEKLPTPLLIVSRTGRVGYANPAAHDGAAAAAAGRALRQPDPRPGLRRGGRPRRSPTARSGGSASPPTRAASASSRRGSALLPPDGAFGPEAQAIVQIEDRTETRRAEQLRSDFIANASHELRTPLASIIGYIETLQNHARNDPEARERFLGIMAREAGRMQRLVDDLMSLSRIEMTEHVRPVEDWSLNQIAAESAAALLPVAAPAGRRRSRSSSRRHGAPVLGDRDQLAQVFANLIDNAMKYGGPGATVRVARRAAEQGAPQPPRRDRRGHRPGHPARAHPPADRALLPRQRRLEPQQGRHRARPRHRQAHPEPPRGPARDRLDPGQGQRLHRLAAAPRGRRRRAAVRRGDPPAAQNIRSA